MLDRRLILVSGKGGVGKSAVVAALAILAARRGKRVLAVGLVDGLGLASHLSVDELGYEAHEVRPGVFALAVSRAGALDEYLRTHLRAPKATPTGPLSRALAALVDTAPGVREMVSMGKPIEEMRRAEWDLVIVDAPPLGQLFSYLRAPQTIAELVPAGRVRDQAGGMQRDLADPVASGLVLVTTPDELPVGETEEALDTLSTVPLIELAALIANRVLPPLPVAARTLRDLPPGPYREAAVLHRGLLASQREWLGELEGAVSLPFLFGMHTPGEVAAVLADELDLVL